MWAWKFIRCLRRLVGGFIAGTRVLSQSRPCEIYFWGNVTGTGFSHVRSIPPMPCTHLHLNGFLLPEGQTSEAREPSYKQCSFRNRRGVQGVEGNWIEKCFPTLNMNVAFCRLIKSLEICVLCIPCINGFPMNIAKTQTNLSNWPNYFFYNGDSGRFLWVGYRIMKCGADELHSSEEFKVRYLTQEPS
jgi:hypothetical protein